LLLVGDEVGHTQEGNNNGYCQDSPLSSINWDFSKDQRDLLAFVRRLIRLRRENPVFRRRDLFRGRPIHGLDVKDLYWLTPSGMEMADPDWNAVHVQCLGMGLMGDQIEETDEHGRRIIGDSFLILSTRTINLFRSVWMVALVALIGNFWSTPQARISRAAGSCAWTTTC
jgi:glycogen operon protein